VPYQLHCAPVATLDALEELTDDELELLTATLLDELDATLEEELVELVVVPP